LEQPNNAFLVMKIKTLFITALLALLSIMAHGASVMLCWDPNNPAPEGYRVFIRLEGDAYDYTQPAWQGAENNVVLGGPLFGQTHYYVVRAYDGNLESVDSNEVSYTNTSVSIPKITHIGGNS
jgi:hypothetical protein